jgi:hypothetical protein
MAARCSGKAATTPSLFIEAYLEHGIRLNLAADKNPDANVTGWQRA